MVLRLSCDRSAELFSSLPDSVQSQVNSDAFATFLSELNGEEVRITTDNISDLSQLCEKFGSWGLSSQLTAVRASSDYRKNLFQEKVLRQKSEIEIFSR
jgi:hypothetical protein